MILTKSEIEKLISEKKLVVKPLLDDTIRENGLDLRIAPEYAIMKPEKGEIDIVKVEDVAEYFEIRKNVDKIVIPPGQFVLLSTLEYVKLPENIVGLCNLRSTFARWGLVIPPTVVDAGFEGNITIELVNCSPNTIVLRPYLRFLHLVLVKTKGEVKYSGKYSKQRGVTLPKPLRDEYRHTLSMIKAMRQIRVMYVEDKEKKKSTGKSKE